MCNCTFLYTFANLCLSKCDMYLQLSISLCIFTAFGQCATSLSSWNDSTPAHRNVSSISSHHTENISELEKADSNDSGCILTDPCREGSICGPRCRLYRELKKELDPDTLRKWFELSDYDLAFEIKNWVDNRELADKHIEDVILSSSVTPVMDQEELRYGKSLALFLLLTLVMLLIVPLLALTLVFQVLLRPMKRKTCTTHKYQHSQMPQVKSPPSPYQFLRLVITYLQEHQQQSTSATRQMPYIASQTV